MCLSKNGTVHTVYESCQQLVTLEKMEKITMIGRIDYCTNVVGNYYSITCDVSVCYHSVLTSNLLINGVSYELTQISSHRDRCISAAFQWM